MLTLIIALSLSTPAPEQGQTDRVLERVDGASQYVSSALETVAEKLGTTIEYLWPAYVRRVKVRSAIGVLGGIVGLLVGAAFFVLFYRRMSAEKKYRIERGYSETTDAEDLYTFLTIVVPIVCLVIGCSIVGSYLYNFIVPEPRALEDLMQAIKG